MENKFTRYINKAIIFKTRIWHNPSSQNIFGLDFKPRYWVEALELLDVREFTDNPYSINRGFKKDFMLQGLYSRAVPGETKASRDVDFLQIREKIPYGFRKGDLESYSNWWQAVSIPVMQNNLINAWHTAINAGAKEIPHSDNVQSYVDSTTVESEKELVSRPSDFSITNKQGVSFTRL